MKRVLLLSGTCGSGKSTVAQLLADEHGWTRVSEDDLWRSLFHRRRGQLGTDEHRQKRLAVRRQVVERVRAALTDVVVDATVHEAEPASIGEYRALFATAGFAWRLRVLHPRLEVAIARDAAREGWSAGASGVESLWRKFSGVSQDGVVFLDTSDDEPGESATRVLESLRDEPAG